MLGRVCLVLLTNPGQTPTAGPGQLANLRRSCEPSVIHPTLSMVPPITCVDTFQGFLIGPIG